MVRIIKNPPTAEPDNYREKVLKLIPTEVIGVYLAVNAMVVGQTPEWVQWIVFAVCLPAVPLWLRYAQNVRSTLQIVLSSVSFVIWVMSTEGAFGTIPGYKPLYGGIALVLCSGLVFPLLGKMVKPDDGSGT